MLREWIVVSVVVSLCPFTKYLYIVQFSIYHKLFIFLCVPILMKRNAIKDEDRLIAHNSLIARMKCYFFISCERFLIVKRVVCNVQHLRYWHLLLKSIIPFHHEESPVSLFFVCVIIVSCDVLSDCRLYRFVWIVLPRAFQLFCYFRLLSLLFATFSFRRRRVNID